MTVVFWMLLAVVAYGYVGYPLTVAVAGRLIDRRVRKEPVAPTISVVIAAYDEAEVIADRLKNLLSTTYPADRLEIVVASDGSKDDTVALASGIDPERIKVLDLPRRGKAAALADGAAHATGEILVFSDANTMFRPDALAMLARNFADPEVGGVAGRTGYVVSDEAEAAGHGEDLYWRYDTWLKSLETRAGSVVSAHGGMYAIRRELFRPVEDAAVTDDFAISTGVVDQGRRLVFEPDAVGHESTMVESTSEFHRRVRLMTRGLYGVILRRRLLNPFRYGFYAVALGSRKLLRRLLPLVFPPLLLVSAASAPDSWFFSTVVAAQIVFLTLAAGGLLLRRRPAGRSPLLYVPFFFLLANVASIVAALNVLRGHRIESWTPHRHEPASLDPGSMSVAGAGGQ